MLIQGPLSQQLFPKGSVIKLPKDATPIDFAYAVHTKIGNHTIACKVNGNDSELQSILYNGDVVDIITSKNKSPSLHWIPVTKTGKARSAIRKYWYTKGEEKAQRIKKYNTTLWISLPDKPGKLGEITTLLGQNSLNISSVEMKEKSKEYINFKFNLMILNFISFCFNSLIKFVKFFKSFIIRLNLKLIYSLDFSFISTLDMFRV